MNGNITRYNYDANGYIMETMDALGNAALFECVAMDRLLQDYVEILVYLLRRIVLMGLLIKISGILIIFSLLTSCGNSSESIKSGIVSEMQYWSSKKYLIMVRSVNSEETFHQLQTSAVYCSTQNSCRIIAFVFITFLVMIISK